MLPGRARLFVFVGPQMHVLLLKRTWELVISPRARSRAQSVTSFNSTTLDATHLFEKRGTPLMTPSPNTSSGSAKFDPFAIGAALKDPADLFISSIDGDPRRASDFHEDKRINEEAMTTFVRAVTLNNSKAKA